MDVFGSLAVILGLAAVGGMVAKFLKQPVVVGYLLAGMLVAILGWETNVTIVEIMGKLGVTLLLFLVGLELPISELKKTGSTAFVAGAGQILVSWAFGFGIATAFGFFGATAVYIGLALAFTSTIIVVKILSEKGDLQSLHGRIALGILLVQDVVAIGVLMWLSGLGIWRLIFGLGVVGIILWLSGFLLPSVVGWLAQSTELLFIASIGWCLVIAAIMSSKWVGFSVEIGGLVAGLALANAAWHIQIMARVRPLRDFFLTWFFVALGANVVLGFGEHVVWPAIIFSIFVVLINPVVIFLILEGMGYRRRTAFLAGTSMAQISEFSLIVISAAVSAGLVGRDVLGLVTIVGMVTMIVGSYVMGANLWIYEKLGGFLPDWGHKRTVVDKVKLNGHIVLFGYGRTGSILRRTLERLGRALVVVDFDPAMVEKLNKEGVRAVYGDMADVELQKELGVENAELVVSTIPDKTDTLQMLAELGGQKQERPILVVTAVDAYDARDLYKAGADYVLVPQMVGGDFLANIFEHQGLNVRWEGLKREI